MKIIVANKRVHNNNISFYSYCFTQSIQILQPTYGILQITILSIKKIRSSFYIFIMTSNLWSIMIELYLLFRC